MTVATPRLTNEEIVRLNRQYTFFSWSAQAHVNPIVMDRAEGVYFWDRDGKRSSSSSGTARRARRSAGSTSRRP